MDFRDDAAHLMRAISTFPQIFVYRRIVDFRKSIDGLGAIVVSELKQQPFSGALFVFMGRRRDRIKILYWDKTGFAIWYKRLEEARFAWPRGEIATDVVVMTEEQLEWLLSGVDVWKIKTHPILNFENIS
jgi:transposase